MIDSQQWTSLLTLVLATTAASAIALLLGRWLREKYAVVEDVVCRLTFVVLLLVPALHFGLRACGAGWMSTGEKQVPQVVIAPRNDGRSLAVIPDSMSEIPSSRPAFVSAEPSPDPSKQAGTHSAALEKIATPAIKSPRWELPTSVEAIQWTRLALLSVSLAGTVFLLCKLTLGSIGIWRVLRRCERLTPEQSLRLTGALGGQVDDAEMGRRFRISSQVAGPAVVGVLRPKVVLPEGMLESADDSQLQAVAMHELAHIERHDPVIHQFARVVAAVWWWNPFVRSLFERLQYTTELACDRRVLSELSAPDYAEILMQLAGRYRHHGRGHLSLTMVPPRSERLVHRVSSVLATAEQGTRLRATRRQWIAIATLAVLSGVGLSNPMFRTRAVAMEDEPDPAPVAAQAEHSEDAGDAETPVTGTLVGTILLTGGKPAAGAAVLLRKGWEGAMQETRADEEGKFRFSGLTGKRYIIWAYTGQERSGDRYRVDDAFLDDEGIQKEPITLKLKPGETFRVRIVDSSGKPVAGAKLRAGWMQWIAADADGWVMTPPLTAERWLLKMRADGFAEAGLSTAPNMPEQTVTLGPEAVIRGIVRDEVGEPIDAANLSINIGESRLMRHWLSAKTDSHGAYEFRGVPRDRSLFLRSDKSGYGAETESISTATADDPIELDISMARTPNDGVLSGIVLGHNGDPVAEASVRLRSRNEQDKEVTVTTLDDGSFSASGLLVDDDGYDALTKAQGHATNSTLQLKPISPSADPQPYTIRLKEGRRYQATIVGTDGSPMPGVQLSVNYLARPIATSDAQGRIDVPNLAVDANISLYGGGFNGKVESTPNFDDPDQQFVSRPKGRIRGTVVDSKGAPVTNFRLRAWFTPDHEPGDANGGISGRLSEGRDIHSPEGQFEITDMRTGTAVQLIVDASGYRTAILRRAVVVDSTKDKPVAIKLKALQPGESTVVAGRLVRADGQAAAGAVLRLLVGMPDQSPDIRWEAIYEGKPDRSAMTAQNLSAVSAPDGSFRFEGVQPGGSITLLHRGGGVPNKVHRDIEKLTVAGQANLQFKGDPGSRIIVKVSDKFASERFVFDLSDSDGERLRESVRLKDAQWSAGDLPPGDYKLEVWPSSTDEGSTDVVVHLDPGETKTIEYPEREEITVNAGEGINAVQVLRSLFGSGD